MPPTITLYYYLMMFPIILLNYLHRILRTQPIIPRQKPPQLIISKIPKGTPMMLSRPHLKINYGVTAIRRIVLPLPLRPIHMPDVILHLLLIGFFGVFVVCLPESAGVLHRHAGAFEEQHQLHAAPMFEMLLLYGVVVEVEHARWEALLGEEVEVAQVQPLLYVVGGRGDTVDEGWGRFYEAFELVVCVVLQDAVGE